MKPVEFVVAEWAEVLRFLKSRFPMYHLSNIFFRDIQYGIMTMLGERGVRVSYVEAERSARAFIARMEREKVFSPIDRQTWVVRYPDFRTPVRVSPQAKPAGGVPQGAKAASPGAGPAAVSAAPATPAAKPVGNQTASEEH